MKLLGSNDGDCLLPASGHKFKPYYKKPGKVNADRTQVIFYLKKPPKYRFVTVPMTTKFDMIAFSQVDNNNKTSTMLDNLLILKDGDEINIIDFGLFKKEI